MSEKEVKKINPMKKLVLTLKQVQGFQEIPDYKEVKQGGI